MKRCLLGFVIFLSLLMAGCVTYHPKAEYRNLTQETWMRHIETNPDIWMRKADVWFLNGRATEAELHNLRAPRSVSVSLMNVNVDDFTSIKVNGNFQVQIYGSNAEHNSLNIYGSNAAIRSIGVSVRNHTLYLEQGKVAPESGRYAVVRIGVRRLNSLTQMGCGSIEAVLINSKHFTMTETAGASGPVFVAGHLNLVRVTHEGVGTINVIGVDSTHTAIYSRGAGAINLCGKIGVKTIYHTGSANINLIGANSQSLEICAYGSGKIGIKGRVGLTKVDAGGKVRVYVDSVISHKLNVTLKDDACVGLLGCADDLTIYTRDDTRFFGRFLCTRNAYVKAADRSQVNVTASDKFFAHAYAASTVYFYGPRSIMSAFTSSYGRVMYIMNADFRMCFPAGVR
ncbi:MAG: hypothetical protein A3F14_02760 [Gammaproteobacteria bacterium RIFCSPHIGHO2_12_FULL_43_28]|nr:MAG: hypothetical protein A3F14_02760 [Gammaproteobacteria bacterium RIFCSPHIGHO2_12_FULL_43_28]